MKSRAMFAIPMLWMLANSLAFADTAATAPDAGLKVAAKWHDADDVILSSDKDGAAITIISPSGIGDLTLDRTTDHWPAKLTIVFQYAPGRPFTNLEGFLVNFDDAGEPLHGFGNVQIGLATLDLTKAPAGSKRLKITWVDAYRR